LGNTMKLEDVQTQKMPEGVLKLKDLLSGSSINLDDLKAEIDMEDEAKDLDSLDDLKPANALSLPKDISGMQKRLVKAPVLPDFMKDLMGSW